MNLTKQQMLKALDGLILECERIHQQFLRDYQPWTGDFAAWLKACESTVETIFGSYSVALSSFKAIYFLPPPYQTFANALEESRAKITWFESGLRFARSTLIGYKYSVDRLAPEEPQRPIPNIFISHGGPTRTHVDLVRDFVSALGLLPIVVADMPNLNLSVNEKVRAYMSISAGAIVLATEEDETLAHEKRARPNVENEIGMLQTSPNIASRIIYMKEPGVQFASNYQEKVWIQFQKEKVQEAFIQLAQELRAFGFIS